MHRPNNNGFCDPNEPLNAGFQRAAVDGAFKAPGLRNQELLAPYMHNGGFATLAPGRRVLQPRGQLLSD